MSVPAEAFRARMIERGLSPPVHIEPGRIHRFPINGKAGSTAGWCKLFSDCMGGVFGSWAEGWKESWQAERDKPLTVAERADFNRKVREAQREREEQERLAQAEVAKRAAELWDAATEAPADHPYLQRKGIKPHGLRMHDGALVAPVRIAGRLTSLQFIAADGDKRFLPGGAVRGGYVSIGKPDGQLAIAEGFATAASIREATGIAVAVAFNAGNLVSVATALRKKLPDVRLILAADDDAGTVGNPGLTKAREAAQAVDGLLAVPEFGEARPDGVTDFNDLARHAGLDAVQACIERAANLAAPATAAHRARELDTAREPTQHAILTRADRIRLEAVTWLWHGWLAAGKLHIIAGAPGTGKTTLALAMAATMTVGGRWPDRTQAERGSVVMWSGEDDPGDTLAPRLKAMGADLSRVHFVSAITGPKGERLPFDPARDVDLLSAAMANLSDVRLLIVDPIVSAVAGDSHNNAETRRSLQPLVDLAAARRCALVGITHLSKGTAGRDPVERVTGSVAFGALARVVLMAARQEAEENKPAQRLLMRAKSNIGLDTGGFIYDLRQIDVPGHAGIAASTVLWGATVEGSARDLLAEVEQRDDDRGASTEAADFLRNLLADGAMTAKDIYRDAEGAGFSRDAMKRAKSRIGAITRKQGMSGGWLWSLPTEGSTKSRRDPEGSEGRDEEKQRQGAPFGSSHPGTTEERTEGSGTLSFNSSHSSLPSGDDVLPSGETGEVL